MKRWHAKLVTTLLVALPSAVSAQRAADAELRGNVVSATTSEPIAGAWIALADREFGTFSRRDGHFELPDVPGAPRRYLVDALGYAPSTLTLDPTDDEPVITLEPDTSLQSGLAFLFEHLQKRRRGGRVFDRQALAFSGAFDVDELLAMRGVRGIRKVCLDERWSPGLLTSSPEGFYMMEIDGGTARLYTEEFLQEMAMQGPDAIQSYIRRDRPAC
ncbi:MAG: carboxypeptidase regulatory-like domain-containing protein [Gemmatimonadales bacterium]